MFVPSLGFFEGPKFKTGAGDCLDPARFLFQHPGPEKTHGDLAQRLEHEANIGNPYDGM